MNTPLSPAARLRAELHASHPDLSFDVVNKEETAFADDPLVLSELVGVVVGDMMIVDPFASSCGRFEVSPEEAYGIPSDVAAKIIAHNIASTGQQPYIFKLDQVHLRQLGD